ncbi:MAG: hypothetical protein HY209_02640 [Candidatus Omnitrophica bacterium]|nr:hypothetical protein [Candidatus Omnitrophota bacterium]
MKNIRYFVILIIIIAAGVLLARRFYEQNVLTQIIARLEASSRVAQVLVVGVNYNEEFKKNFTTIKFLEYDTKGKPLTPKYFTFPGNIIQFQSLVVRFDDRFVAAGDRLRGKSVYLFWKVFCLDGASTKEFPITYLEEVPGGYQVSSKPAFFENHFWRQFWHYAFDQQAAARAGIKNVQIEAPGVVFIPGYLYTINIEHDGGLRIDTTPLADILKGETIPK